MGDDARPASRQTSRMPFPTVRPRRLRRTERLRAFVRETQLSPSDFVYPLFVCPGSGVKQEIGAMPNNFRLLYEDDAPIADKIKAVATQMYGADGVDISAEARRQITAYGNWGLGNLPICIAKTNLSLSADANKRGRPSGFRVSVREVRPASGAGLQSATGEALVRVRPPRPRRPATRRRPIV